MFPAPRGRPRRPKGDDLPVETTLNLAWTLLLALAGLALPVGVGMLAAAPAKRGLGAAGRLLLAGALAVLVSLGCGFSLQYGALYAPQLGEGPRQAWQWTPLGEGSGLLSWAGPFVSAEPGRLVLALLQAMSAAAVVVLALGPVGQRLHGPGLAAVALFVGGVLYPLLGHWVWGGGWLAATGRAAYLGHGFVDWGGAGPLYALGGMLGLAGLLGTGARRDIPVDDAALPLGAAPIALLGILALNLTGAWSLVPRLPLVAVNTLVSAAAGGVVAVAYMAFTSGRLCPAMLTRGLLAGAVASAGIAPFAPPLTLALVGAGAGLIACLGTYLVVRLWRLDDPAGLVPTFGWAGLWGVLAVGLFADGTYGQGLNGVGEGLYLGVAGQGVSGIALLSPGYVPDFGQLVAQLLGLLVILAWALALGSIFFRLSASRVGGRDG